MGCDRTGVVVAAVLTIVGIERATIVEEYLLSDGEVSVDWIELALDGIADTERYFNRAELGLIRSRFSVPD